MNCREICIFSVVLVLFCVAWQVLSFETFDLPLARACAEVCVQSGSCCWCSLYYKMATSRKSPVWNASWCRDLVSSGPRRPDSAHTTPTCGRHGRRTAAAQQQRRGGVSGHVCSMKNGYKH